METEAKRWEYKTLSILPGGKKPGLASFFGIGVHADERALEASLNALGAEGWELVSTTQNAVLGRGVAGTDTFVFVFKRQVSSRVRAATPAEHESVQATDDGEKTEGRERKRCDACNQVSLVASTVTACPRCAVGILVVD